MRRALIVVLAGVVAGLAAWAALGAIALIPSTAAPSIGRIGLLPSPAWALTVALLAAIWSLRRPSVAPTLGLVVLTLLPWLPIDLPAPVLLWTGPLAAVVWSAWLVAALVASQLRWPESLRVWTRDPRRAVRLAFVLAAVSYGGGLWLAARTVPGGDEPHYLIIARSLLADGDLRIDNNHAQRDYLAWFEGELKPDYLRRSVDGAIYSIHAPGLPALIAPALALGGHRAVMVFLLLVSATGASLAWRLAYEVSGDVAAAWFGWAAVALSAPFFLHAFTVYPDACASVLVVSGLLAFVRIGPRGDVSSAPATAVERPPMAAPPMTVPAMTVPAMTVPAMTVPAMTVPAMTGARAAMHGAALAALPWLHTRYVLLAASLGIVIVVRLLRGGRRREAASFLALPILSALGWFAFFQAVYGTPSPAAPYGGYTQTALAHILPGLTGLLVDQQFGLLATAPVLVGGVIGLVAMIVPAQGVPADQRWAWRSLAIALLLLIVPYAEATASYQMWWGGFSAPARFFVPLVLPLAVPLAVWWTRTRTSATRALALWAAIWSVGFAWILVGVEDGAMAWTTRTTQSAWARWISPLVDVARGLPSAHRGPIAVTLLQTAVWAAVASLAWVALRQAERRWRLSFRAVMTVWAPAAMALAAMLGLAAAWQVEGATPLRVAASQVALVNRAAAVRPRIGVDFAAGGWPFLSMTRESPETALRQLRLASDAGRIGGASTARGRVAPNQPVLTLPAVPAGRYRLQIGPEASGAGRLSVSVGRSVAPIVTFEAGHATDPRRETPAFELTLPVGVDGLIVRSEHGAPAGAVTLQPLVVSRDGEGARQSAGFAAAFGDVTVYFTSDGVFPEATGFWVRAGVDATVVIAHPSAGAPLEVRLRNAPIANQVSLEAGAWRQSADLEPGAERLVTLPPPGSSRITVLHIRAERGVRPADRDPANRDMRRLGVWVEIVRI